MAFAHSLPNIIRLFPNITLMVDDVSRLDAIDALRDTVTGAVLQRLNFATLVPSILKFADRIVEVHCGFWTHDTRRPRAIPQPDQAQRLCVSRSLSLLQKKLRRLQVNCSPYGKNPLVVFPSECTEQTFVIYSHPRVFSFEGRSPSPTNSTSSVMPPPKTSHGRISSRG